MTTRDRRRKPARRYYFFKEVAAGRLGDDGLADAWHSKRLAEVGTALPSRFPWRSAAVALDVRAIEDLDGASVRALEDLGFTRTQATDIFNRIEGIHVTTLYFQSGLYAGQSYDQDDVTLLASAARTATFNGDSVEVGDRGTLRLDLAITAASGTTPTLQVQIETRKDSDDTWRTVDAFPVQTTTATVRKTFAGLDRQVRAVSSIAGTTPSFTYSLTGEAV
jgi:hypothetical protein